MNSGKFIPTQKSEEDERLENLDEFATIRAPKKVNQLKTRKFGQLPCEVPHRKLTPGYNGTQGEERQR